MPGKVVLKWVFGLFGVGGMLLMYWLANPYEVDFLPRCPFHALTGFTCPGCGSQRSIHFLLHLDVVSALRENLLLVLSLPYLLAFGLFRLTSWDHRRPALRKALFGPLAVKIILLLVISFWIGRNVWAFWAEKASGRNSQEQASSAFPPCCYQKAVSFRIRRENQTYGKDAAIFQWLLFVSKF